MECENLISNYQQLQVIYCEKVDDLVEFLREIKKDAKERNEVIRENEADDFIKLLENIDWLESVITIQYDKLC